MGEAMGFQTGDWGTQGRESEAGHGAGTPPDQESRHVDSGQVSATNMLSDSLPSPGLRFSVWGTTGVSESSNPKHAE